MRLLRGWSMMFRLACVEACGLLQSEDSAAEFALAFIIAVAIEIVDEQALGATGNGMAIGFVHYASPGQTDIVDIGFKFEECFLLNSAFDSICLCCDQRHKIVAMAGLGLASGG